MPRTLQDEVFGPSPPGAAQPVCPGCSGFWVLSSKPSALGHPRAGPKAPQKRWEPDSRWWPGQALEARRWPRAPGTAFGQHPGHSWGGGLALWGQRASLLLSRGLTARPKVLGVPACPLNPAACLDEEVIPGAPLALGQDPSCRMGPHRWGGGSSVTPGRSGPTQGSGKGTASRGDLLGKGRWWVGSFACRGHRCESCHRGRI